MNQKGLRKTDTVEPVLGDHPFCPAKTVSQDRWSLIAGRTKIMFYRCVIFTNSQAVTWVSETGMALVFYNNIKMKHETSSRLKTVGWK